MNTKEMLKNGFEKKTVALVISRDSYSGKQHYVVVDSIENAKEFKTGESIQQVTMYFKKENNND